MVVQNDQGLHVRPAALFVTLANKFDAEITVRKGRQKANGKSITSIMMLGCEKGSEVEIFAKGPDAARAVKELTEFLAKGIVEPEKK